MAVMGGWKIYTRNGGKPGMREELALKWGDGKFVVSLHSWQRSANLLFYEDPPYIAYPPATTFSNFDHPSSPPPIPTSNSYPHGLFCCPVSLAEWVITPHLMYYFT